MKIGIQTWGSQGDIQPFITLAEGLQTAGHEVTLALTSVDHSFQKFKTYKRSFKLDIVASPVIENNHHFADIEKNIFDEADPLKQTQSIIENLLLPAEQEMYQAAETLCSENDLVIGHFFHYPLKIASEKMACNYVSVALVHSAIPSSHIPPSGLPNLGKLSNRFFWWLVKRLLNKKIKPYSDALKLSQGMEPSKDLMTDIWASEQLTLVAVSPEICQPQPDWPDNYQICGFLAPQPPLHHSELPNHLNKFLQQGTPPVYVTFGSALSGNEIKQTLNLIQQALSNINERAIIQLPEWKQYGLENNNSIYYVDTMSHSAIFPHCSAIVHHGGAGTSQTALMAGKPSIVIAHTSEQMFWGNELARIHVAPAPLKRQGLTSQKLAKQIKLAVHSKKFNQNAEETGQKMQQENGTAKAIKLIQQHFSH